MGLDHIGGRVRNTLADAYRMRAQGEGPWPEPRHPEELEFFAAALLARDLMAGDPASLKVGYSRANAVLAAIEMFPDARDFASIEEALDDLKPIWRFVVEQRAWSEAEAREQLAAGVRDSAWGFDLESRLEPEQA